MLAASDLPAPLNIVCALSPCIKLIDVKARSLCEPVELSLMRFIASIPQVLQHWKFIAVGLNTNTVYCQHLACLQDLQLRQQMQQII